MKAVIQRVNHARVEVSGQTVGAIGPGLLVYLGLEKGDGEADLEWVGTKILGLRCFEDGAGKMNLDLGDRGLLLVSQFTLAGDLRRGRRPGFDAALPVDEARAWWPRVVSWFRERHPSLATGEFQAAMTVTSANDGPATFWLDSRNR
jgi:D-tyrosyl-tRNA(Tyr) deacylase